MCAVPATRRGVTSQAHASRLPLFSLLCAADIVLFIALGVLLGRLGMVAPATGFFVAALSVVPALLGTVLAVFSLWRHGHDGRAVTALFVGGGFLVAAFILGVRWAGVPRINDITTDTADPPVLVRGDVMVPYPAGNAAAQRDGYPELTSLTLAQAPDAVFAMAVENAEAAGWRVVSGDGESLTIRATVMTRVFRFVDDVVVRVRSDGTGAVVDVRSVSRVGTSDLGTNARRIRKFLAGLRARVD